MLSWAGPTSRGGSRNFIKLWLSHWGTWVETSLSSTKTEPMTVVLLKPADQLGHISRLLRSGQQARLYNGGGGYEKQREKLLP